MSNEVIDLDKIYKPITFIIEGKEYAVKEVTPEMMEEITVITETPDITPMASVVKQFCLITGEDEKAVYKIPMRKIRRTLQMITGKVLGYEESEKNELPEDTQKE